MVTVSKWVLYMLAGMAGLSLGLAICHEIELLQVDKKLAKLDGFDTGMVSLMAAISHEGTEMDKRITVLENK